jgi:hypothetical protein
LDDDALVYRYRGGEKRFPFDQRLSIRFYCVPCVIGWGVIQSESRIAWFTVGIKGIVDLLRELKATLDVRGLWNCYDRVQLFNFLKTAEVVEQSSERMHEVIGKYLLFTLAGAALGLIFALVGQNGIIGTVLWILASALWPPVVNSTAEVVFICRLARLADEKSFTCPSRDRAWERVVFRKAIGWGLGVYLVIAAAILACQLWVG